MISIKEPDFLSHSHQQTTFAFGLYHNTNISHYTTKQLRTYIRFFYIPKHSQTRLSHSNKTTMWSPISKWLARHPKAAQSTFLSATLTLGICLLIYYNASEISVAKRTVLTTTTSSPAFVTAFVQNLSSNIGAIISSKLESRTVDVDVSNRSITHIFS